MNRSSDTLSGVGSDVVAPAELPTIATNLSAFRSSMAVRLYRVWYGEKDGRMGIPMVVPYREVAD